jgi:4-amino-4-deoxy-L-arabinose transferase-like glycosyltransferase
MKRFFNWKLFLLLIVLAAGLLRFYDLGSVPSSLFRDEVSIGYNAYSILTTGKDEHGIFLPLSLQSLGDQKLPLYVYSVVPFIKIFGLTDFAPRIPAAIAGVLIVLLTYFLVEELFKKKNLSLLASFFMAISPWGIFSSRITHETTLSLLFTIIATLLFLKSKEKKWLICISFIFFGLTLFTYHASQIFTPIFVVGLIILNKNVWQANKKQFLIGAFVFCLIAILSFAITFSGDLKKISGVGIFSNSSIQYYKIERPRNEHFENVLVAKILYNKFTAYPFVLGENYLSAFSPDFLFNKGGQNPWESMEQMGYFYLIDSVFIFLGIIFMIKKKEKSINNILLWLLIAPIPGAITIDAPGEPRVLTMLVPLIILIAYGVYSSCLFLLSYKKKVLGYGGIVAIAIIYFVSFVFFLDSYFVLFPINRAVFYGYGYKQEAQISSTSKAKKIIVSGLYDYTYPYFLYYLDYSADKFRSQVKYAALTSDNFLPVKSFDKFNFVDTVDWKTVCNDNDVLIFDAYSNFPKSIQPDGIIYLPDKTSRFAYIEVNQSKCLNFENSLIGPSIVR